ncbi:MAG TPA: hypothetical protein VL551_21755 [Actinospica sp.]|nr:hypothetical protein [Actinospica sp.]
MVLSLPVLAVLGGLLVFFMRSDGLRVSHLLVAAMVGAQVSTTVIAAQLNTVFTTANHLLSTVFS